MTTITVSSSAALLSALNQVQAGDTILLDPGTYSAISIQDFHLVGDVTIASSDPSNPAVLQRLKVESSSGLNFSNLEFSVDPAGSLYQFQILYSNDIHLSNIDVHGVVDGNPTYDLIGLRLKGNEDISVTDSRFHDLESGIYMGANDGISIVGCEFYGIRKDGIQDTVGSSNVLISENYFHDFFHLEGDHSDAMQFGTYNATSSPTNIVITNNVIMQGKGTSLQGIFMGNEKSIPYENVTISGNLIADGHWHGISVYLANGLTIQDNIVLAINDESTWILAKDAVNAQINGNESSLITLNGEKITTLGNVAIAAVLDGGETALQQWLAGKSSILAQLPDSLTGGLSPQFASPGEVVAPVVDPAAAPAYLYDASLGLLYSYPWSTYGMNGTTPVPSTTAPPVSDPAAAPPVDPAYGVAVAHADPYGVWAAMSELNLNIYGGESVTNAVADPAPGSVVQPPDYLQLLGYYAY